MIGLRPMAVSSRTAPPGVVMAVAEGHLLPVDVQENDRN